MQKITIFVLGLLIWSLSLLSCRSHCGDNKEEFMTGFQSFIKEVKTNKMKRDDKNWDLLDRRFRIYLQECQPRYSAQFTEEESYLFWQQSMGYMYARYGLNLLKKFKDTDDLILRLRDSLAARKIDIPLAMDSLSKDWPILMGTSGSNLGFRLEKILRKKTQDTLLPAWRE